MNWVPVTSSNIQAIRQSRNDLDVLFLDGRAVRYYRAGFHYAYMLKAASKGQYLHWRIKTAGWKVRGAHFEYITP